MCLYPKLIQNPKYKKSKKNGGIIPHCFDQRVMLIPVGCGKCMECRKKKARDWNIRLQEEIRNTKLKGYFVTLTFNDKSFVDLMEVLKKKGSTLDGYDLDNEIASLAVGRFVERWRKKHKKSVRHWLVTELGGTKSERLHLHGIIWTDLDSKNIVDKWMYGICDIGDKGVFGKTASYVVKYLHKQDVMHKEYIPKMYVSNGIGRGYVDRTDSNRNRFKVGKTNELYKSREGYEMSLPPYYRNKLYSEDERELLWLEKLDKQERWVNGIRVDVSENDDDYYKLLNQERKKNKRLGFGDDSVNWELKRYENDKRNLKKKALRSGSSPEGQGLVS